MTIITRITVHPKKKDWYYVYIDCGAGEEFGFTIDSDLFIRFRLQKGMEIDHTKLMEIVREKEKKRAIGLALSYLSYRMRSEHELIEYLKRKELDYSTIVGCIDTLKSYHYINDEEFSNQYVQSKMNTQLKGPLLIKRELEEKGVSSTIISSSLSRMSFESQVSRLISYIEKKQEVLGNTSLKEKKQKIYQQLYRKGFSRDVIQTAFAQAKWEYSDQAEHSALQYHGEKALYKYRKYTGYEKKMRVKQYLVRKGFTFEQIDTFLQNNEDE
ncbi:recombination regulator RecX [Massilibacterium senegalense]|uniref:recombination regulator RecX n=1 Tax=Massilibacterium senegalense TaxID=1632858 RepID=UPI00078313C3|nr:recombination regulator RecX [Massilibacterium senegalense]